MTDDEKSTPILDVLAYMDKIKESDRVPGPPELIVSAPLKDAFVKAGYNRSFFLTPGEKTEYDRDPLAYFFKNSCS